MSGILLPKGHPAERVNAGTINQLTVVETARIDDMGSPRLPEPGAVLGHTHTADSPVFCCGRTIHLDVQLVRVTVPEHGLGPRPAVPGTGGAAILHPQLSAINIVEQQSVSIAMMRPYIGIRFLGDTIHECYRTENLRPGRIIMPAAAGVAALKQDKTAIGDVERIFPAAGGNRFRIKHRAIFDRHELRGIILYIYASVSKITGGNLAYPCVFALD